MSRLLLCAVLSTVASAGSLYGIVNPMTPTQGGSWAGLISLPNASLQERGTAPTNFQFAAGFAGLSADSATFYTLCVNLTTTRL